MSFGGRHMDVGDPSGLGYMSWPSDAVLERAVGLPYRVCAATAPRGPQRSALSAAGLGIWEGWGLVPRAGIAVGATEMSCPWP